MSLCENHDCGKHDAVLVQVYRGKEYKNVCYECWISWEEESLFYNKPWPFLYEGDWLHDQDEEE